MKTTILSIFLVCASVFSFASGTAGPGKIVSRHVEIEGNFTRLLIDENIKVVLVPATSGSKAMVTGHPSLVDRVKFDLSRSTLSLTTDGYLYPGNEVTVVLPVEDLTDVSVAPGALMTSQGDLHFSNLTVMIDIDSRVDLKVTGNVSLKAAPDCEFIQEISGNGQVYMKR